MQFLVRRVQIVVRQPEARQNARDAEVSWKRPAIGIDPPDRMYTVSFPKISVIASAQV